VLALEDVTFAYADSAAYHFTAEAQPGEITAIRGQSGAGKSTLLDLIAGFLVPASGTIRIDGADVTPLSPEQRPVSILFQSETLFEHLSASRNVALGLARPDAARIASALAEVGLDGIGPQRAATLSGGQKQRVALARTLLRQKPVLLLDEPFSALDDETRETTRALVKSLTLKHKWATLLVTHHADDIAVIADRVYRLETRGLVRER
jgi:thiamine transport system ATP-binding protein